MAGYSGTPLAQKLGIRAGSRIRTRHAPDHYRELLEPLPENIALSPRLRSPVDIVHIFARARAGLAAELRQALQTIHPDGAIWVSWPKRASGVATDMTEDVVREVALPLGLVDIKVCAVDATWSGLKLVIRRSERHRFR